MREEDEDVGDCGPFMSGVDESIVRESVKLGTILRVLFGLCSLG